MFLVADLIIVFSKLKLLFIFRFLSHTCFNYNSGNCELCEATLELKTDNKHTYSI